MTVSAYQPETWPLGADLIVSVKISFPKVTRQALEHFEPFRDEMITNEALTLFPPERCKLMRLLNHGKHAICQHAGSTLFIASTKHLTPLKDS